MGRILGYPCYAEFNSISSDSIQYGIEIRVEFEDGDTIQILANKCKNEERIPAFQGLAHSIEEVLKRGGYADLPPVANVEAIVDTIIPTKFIIHKLIRNEPISQPIQSQILNLFYNLSFTDRFIDFFENNFQYHNPVHRGILLSLLLNSENDLIEPFQPLNPSENEEVEKQTEKWADALMKLISDTKTTHTPRPKTAKRGGYPRKK